MHYLIAQILGACALLLVSISYFFKSKKNFLIFQSFSNFFYALAFIVVKAKVAGIITFISIARCVYVYFCEKYNYKYTYHFLPVFILGYVISTIIFWNTNYDIIPLITSTMFSILFCVKNLQLMRCLMIVPCSLLVFYNILVKTYMSAVLCFVEIIVILGAIFNYLIRLNKNSYQQ